MTKQVYDPLQTDAAFLDYCDLHCRTERALFTGLQINRLLRLAGREPSTLRDNSWTAAHEDFVLPLVRRAWQILTPPQMLIVIEGVDAIGKATQTKLLVERLKAAGVPASSLSFPAYETATGKLILKLLTGKARLSHTDSLIDPEQIPQERREQQLALQALMTVNKLEMVDKIECRTDTLVLDRYWASAVAYGAAEGLDADWLESIHQTLSEPDLWILLDAPVEVGFARRPERRDMNERNAPMLTRARDEYLKLFSKNKLWEIIDAGQGIQQVADAIWNVVKTRLKLENP